MLLTSPVLTFDLTAYTFTDSAMAEVLFVLGPLTYLYFAAESGLDCTFGLKCSTYCLFLATKSTATFFEGVLAMAFLERSDV